MIAFLQLLKKEYYDWLSFNTAHVSSMTCCLVDVGCECCCLVAACLITRWPQHIYLYKLLSARAQLMTSPAVPWYHTDCMVRYQWGAHGRQQDGAGMKAPSWNFNMMPCCSPVKWPKFLLSPSVLVISTPKFGLKRWKISKISFFLPSARKKLTILVIRLTINAPSPISS